MGPELHDACTPDWTPLERRLSAAECAEFMWVFRLAGLEHYKHIVTRRYLRLDRDGRCFGADGAGWKEVSFEDEWKRVSGREG